MKSPAGTQAWTVATTVLAPISWGTTYVTITELLPDGRPLLVSAMRVAPAGLLLVLAGALTSRWRPHGAQWWRTGVLAAFNFGIFFPLLVVAVYRLPGGVAAAAGGLQPLLVVLFSWFAGGERPRRLDLAVGVVAAVGVGLVVVRPGAHIDPIGVVAAVGANISFALGVVFDEAVPSTGEPHRGDRLAAVDGGDGPRTAGGDRRGSAAVALRPQPRRVHLPQPCGDGRRVRALVQRHPSSADRRPSAAWTGRTRDGGDARVGHPR